MMLSAHSAYSRLPGQQEIDLLAGFCQKADMEINLLTGFCQKADMEIGLLTGFPGKSKWKSIC